MNPRQALTTLKIKPPLSKSSINNAYRAAAKKYHPDHGGDHMSFVKAGKAKDILLKCLDIRKLVREEINNELKKYRR